MLLAYDEIDLLDLTGFFKNAVDLPVPSCIVDLFAQREDTMINRIFYRNRTGHLVQVVSEDARRIGFYKLHVNTRQPVGSIVYASRNTFTLRYAEV